MSKKRLLESLSSARSEVGYSPRKAARQAFHKASRVGARGEIESQLADTEPLDTATIAELIPHEDRAEWDRMSGAAAKTGPQGEIEVVRSQRDAYLVSLGWDVSYGDKHIDDIDKLLDLSNAFLDGYNQAYDAQYEEENVYYENVHAVREDHERELREAIRLILQKKIMSEVGWRGAAGLSGQDPGGQGASAGQSYYSGKSISRQSGLGAVGKAKEILHEDDVEELLNIAQDIEQGGISESRLLTLAGLLKD